MATAVALSALATYGAAVVLQRRRYRCGHRTIAGCRHPTSVSEVFAMTRPSAGPEHEARAQRLLDQLSTAEKLGLLAGDTPFWSGMADLAIHDASHRHPWPAGQLPRLGLTGLHFVDGPRGVVLEGGATTFPAPIARGASWNPVLEARIGEAIAREARSFGANWVAAVCVNLLRHPGWGRAQETYGEDPLHVGALGAAMTRGLERHTIACVKHFALNSIDSSRFRVDVQASPRVLHELYLPQFRACVEAGAGSVMSAYNRVNGQWCGQSSQLLAAILKRRWGFQGLVVSDFIFGLRDGVAALLAGLDLEMPFRMILQGCLPLALAEGRLPMARIDDAVLRQLRLQLRIRPGSYPRRLRRCPAHLNLAREAARQAIVLLRNETLGDGQPVLPLRGLQSLAVIGPLADRVNLGDRGSSDTRPPPGAVVTPLQGLRQARPNLTIQHTDGGQMEEAASLASRCEAAVVVVGLDWRLEGEHIHPGDIAPILEQIPPPDWWRQSALWPSSAPLWRRFTQLIARITSTASARQGGDFAAGDRTDLSLPAAQVALIRVVASANPRTVVVLMGGGAILCSDWDQQVPGLLLLWYPGEQGGHALAEVLFGQACPSGRLPFTIPSRAAQLPPFEPRAERVRYDLWHGYRLLQREHASAAYPFGFGLSYCRFAMAEPVAELHRAGKGGQGWVELSVSVRNDGAMAAAEVVQVYLEPPGLLQERAPRSLVAFRRLPLAAGERRRLRLAVPLRRLACFDPGRDAFVLEAGLHRLVVARHAEDPGLVVGVELEASVLGS
jgi:beta-glucosidase